MTVRDLELTMQSGLEALRSLTLTTEAEEAKALLLPEGLTPVVEFLQEDANDDSPTPKADKWSPLTGRILISFRPQLLATETPETADASQNIRRPDGQPRFQPITVRGEPLSTTLLRDRGNF